MEKQEPLIDLFKDPILAEEFINAAAFNKMATIRAIIENDEPQFVVRTNPTDNLMMAFCDRFNFFLDEYYDGNMQLMDFFKERTIWDVYELHQGGGMQVDDPGCIDSFVSEFTEAIELFLPGKPEDYLKDVDKIFEPIEDENEFDKILLAMIHYKFTHNGKMPVKFCDFVLRQCFYEKSAIMQNKEDYEEVVYRFLEEYTKGRAVISKHNAEKRINKLLREELKLDEDPRRTHHTLTQIMDDLSELIRVGWSFRDSTVESFAKFLDRVNLSNEDRKALEGLLSRAYCSAQHDNAPVVVVRDSLGALGTAYEAIVSIDEDHISDLLYGTDAEKLEVISTAEHENTHVSQHINNKNPNTFLQYQELKYYILMVKGVISYQENMHQDIQEREANSDGANNAVEFARRNRLQMDLSPFVREANLQRKLLHRKLKLGVPVKPKDKIIGGKLTHIFERFFAEDKDEAMDTIEDHPVLKVEFDKTGRKRTFKEYLQNARSLLSKRRFLGEEEETDLIINESMAELVRDIGMQEFMTLENLPEVMHCLIKEDFQYEEGVDGKLYKDFIRQLTGRKLGLLLDEARSKIDRLPLDQVEKIAQMCIIAHTYIEAPSEENRLRKSEFIDGMTIGFAPMKKTGLEIMNEFEDAAAVRLGKDYRKPFGINLRSDDGQR